MLDNECQICVVRGFEYSRYSRPALSSVIRLLAVALAPSRRNQTSAIASTPILHDILKKHPRPRSSLRLQSKQTASAAMAPSVPRLSTRLTTVIGITHPILLAGMGTFSKNVAVCQTDVALKSTTLASDLHLWLCPGSC